MAALAPVLGLDVLIAPNAEGKVFLTSKSNVMTDSQLIVEFNLLTNLGGEILIAAIEAFGSLTASSFLN